MGIRRSSRGFRPELEGVERRELAAVGGGLAAFAAAHAGGVHARGYPQPGYPGSHSVAPGMGRGLVRLALPYSFGDFGVVTLWNNTNTRVTFAASASTFNNGRAYLFLLLPGQVKSFYASNTINGDSPVFRISVGPNAAPVTLPYQNTVFETRSYFPSATAGFPYAINIGVNGYYISAI